MKNTVIIKPIFWRLLIWIVVLLTIAWLLGDFTYQVTHPDSIFEINWAMAVGMLLAVSINTIIFRNKYDIVIAEGKVSGIGTGFGLNTVTFPVPELDKASIYKQSIFERIFWFHTLRSTHGHKIMFPHFIYGKAAVKRVYETLDKCLLENADQKDFERKE